MDRAFVELLAYITSTNYHFDEYMGATGSNEGVSLLLDSASIAWDWGFLLFNDPGPEHVQAFIRVQHAFRDILRHTDRPAGDAFPYVSWPWPSDAQVGGQYLILLKRLRNRERRSHCFTRVKHVQVQRLRFPNVSCTVLARNAKQLHLTDAIIWRVFSFLNGGEGPTMNGTVFKTAPA